MKKITESTSNYDRLEQMNTLELLQNINKEDQKVAIAVEQVIPKITPLVDDITGRMLTGGRLFYIGAGTSGRLGILDASECPPTFGVTPKLVIGLMAGGDVAIRKSVEDAEDDSAQGWKDLLTYEISNKDALIGIAASGTTPYVVGALNKAQQEGILTGCITCNQGSPLAQVADHPVEVLVGPEFITGSTRMKSGTAQKLVLNMISTSVMIKLGRVHGNKMVDMQLNNDKLMERGCKMVMNVLNITMEEARQLLLETGSVRKAIGG